MAFHTYPFSDATRKGLEDVPEITMKKTEEKLLEGIENLRNRVIPSQYLVSPMKVLYMLYNIFRMFQRELEFVSRHGENAPHPMWHVL